MTSRTPALPRLVISAGEPAGIGPDIVVQIAQRNWPASLLVIADPALLASRAHALNLPLRIIEHDLTQTPAPHIPQTLAVYPVKLCAPVYAGVLNEANAPYVIETLTVANQYCLEKKAQALVTGPVHKGLLNQAGFVFSGHTEWLAKAAGCSHTVMLFITDKLKVALTTTHLPLADVPKAITPALLEQTLQVLREGLQHHFKISTPRIAVTGLNPHAGEDGYLGREEIEIITPVLEKLRQQNWQLIGPLPADTAFLPEQSAQSDAILAMYHDQALPLIKTLSFDCAVNVTLGLPYLRTSVDHGTALTLAGTGKANAGSLVAAVKWALELVNE